MNRITHTHTHFRIPSRRKKFSETIDWAIHGCHGYILGFSRWDYRLLYYFPKVTVETTLSIIRLICKRVKVGRRSIWGWTCRLLRLWWYARRVFCWKPSSASGGVLGGSVAQGLSLRGVVRVPIQMALVVIGRGSTCIVYVLVQFVNATGRAGPRDLVTLTCLPSQISEFVLFFLCTTTTDAPF